jgi:hypothetical protein
MSTSEETGLILLREILFSISEPAPDLVKNEFVVKTFPERLVEKCVCGLNI